MHADLYTDGSRLDLAGPVGWACEVVSAGRRWHASGVLRSHSVALAELHAVVQGILLARDAGATKLDIFTDSQDVLHLLMGRGGRLLKDQGIVLLLNQFQPLPDQLTLTFHKVQAHHGGCAGNTWVDLAARQVLLDDEARRVGRTRTRRKRR